MLLVTVITLMVTKVIVHVLLFQELLLQLLSKIIIIVNLALLDRQYMQTFICLILFGMVKVAQLIVDAVHKWECQNSIEKHLSHPVKTLKCEYVRMNHTVMKMWPLKNWIFMYFEHYSSITAASFGYEHVETHTYIAISLTFSMYKFC